MSEGPLVNTLPQLEFMSLPAAMALEEKWVQFQRQAVLDGLPLAELPDGRSRVVRVWPDAVDMATFPASNADIFVRGCDRNCSFCFEGPEFLQGNNTLTIETAESLLDLLTLGNGEEATYLGGEVFLQAYASEIIVATAKRMSATGKPMRVRAVTNGAEVAQEKVRDRSVADALSRLAVSREARTPELNDVLRGRDASKRFDEMVAGALAMGITTDMNVTVMRSTVDELRELLFMAQDIGISRVNLHGLTTTTGNAAVRARHEQLSPCEWRERVINQVAKVMLELAERDRHIAVDVESMHKSDSPFANRNDVPFSCEVQERTNMQLVQPANAASKIWELLSCNLYFGTGLSGHVVVVEDSGAKTYKRAGRSELTDTLGCDQGCPARVDVDSGERPPCIYKRPSGAELRVLAFRPGVEAVGRREWPVAAAERRRLLSLRVAERKGR